MIEIENSEPPLFVFVCFEDKETKEANYDWHGTLQKIPNYFVHTTYTGKMRQNLVTWLVAANKNRPKKKISEKRKTKTAR